MARFKRTPLNAAEVATDAVHDAARVSVLIPGMKVDERDDKRVIETGALSITLNRTVEGTLSVASIQGKRHPDQDRPGQDQGLLIAEVRILQLLRMPNFVNSPPIAPDAHRDPKATRNTKHDTSSKGSRRLKALASRSARDGQAPNNAGSPKRSRRADDV